MNFEYLYFKKGQTRNLSEPYFARRTLINKSNAKDVERVMNKFKMVPQISYF